MSGVQFDWLQNRTCEGRRAFGKCVAAAVTSVHSKLMCWVALDRGLRLSRKRSLPADHLKWLTMRDRLYEEIMTKGGRVAALFGAVVRQRFA